VFSLVARKPETTYLRKYLAKKRKETVGKTTASGQTDEIPQNVDT
jgi:Ulp1 family protease